MQIDARALKVKISDNENMDGRDSDMDSNSPLIVDSGLQNTSVRLTPYQTGKRVASPSPCAICCTIFSIIGAVILTLVASYIGSGSKFIIVDKDPENIDMVKRGKMALHMYIAAGMYVGTSLIAGFYWRNPRVKVEWKKPHVFQVKKRTEGAEEQRVHSKATKKRNIYLS